MRYTAERTIPDTVVELRGGIADDLVEYTRLKVGAVLARTGRPVPRSRVRVTRHADPARERPVVAGGPGRGRDGGRCRR